MVLATVLRSILALSGIYTAWSLFCFLRNRRIAKQIGLPYVCFPLSEFNVAYFLFLATPLGKWLVHNVLPRRFSNRVYHSNVLWRWSAKYDFHRQHGDVLLTVTPGSISCSVADADTALELVTSRGRFPKPTWQYAILNIFGENVVTCEDEEWARHRRYTAPPFNERNNRLVWSDSISQALGMRDLWLRRPKDQIATVRDAQQSLRELALHVISSAGFGVYLSFGESSSTSDGETALGAHFSDAEVPAGYHRTYREALEFFNRNIVKVLATLQTFPESFLANKAPQALRQWYDAKLDVERYLLQLLSIERGRSKESGDQVTSARSDNLLSIMVREEKRNSDPASHEPRSRRDAGLTNREIVGNVFIFSVAGHETTAVTLQYALTMLALHQPEQEWLHRKLDEALSGESHNPRDWPYATFSKLDGPLSVMLETLRMFPPIPVIPKWTGSSPQTLSFNNRCYTLPSHTVTNLNCAGLHYNPKYWGTDAGNFQPQRWDTGNKGSFIYKEKNANETTEDTHPRLNKPLRGAFMPFSDGYRSCLGRKFAEIEFVAVLSVLCRTHLFRLEVNPGEMEADARKRVERIIHRSANENSLGMREEFGLVLLER